jgi:hypothetical protein
VRQPEPRRVVSATVAIAVLALGGCTSGEAPPVPPATTAAPSPSAAVTVPADGVTLRSLGYLNGPVEQFTLPRTTLITAAVDQTNNVTAVLTSPPPIDVAAYLRRALPATGFTITADDPGTLALTFAGHGWTGSFTGSAATSAILLRPA